MDDKMTWPPPWRHFLSWASSEEFLVRPQEVGEEIPPEKSNSIRNVLLPFNLLQHIHHLPHIIMSWSSILDRPEASLQGIGGPHDTRLRHKGVRM